MKANYDSMPLVYEANGNGSYTYRWDIEEVERDNEDGTTSSSWNCLEVVVWAGVTKDKITQAVIESLWASDYEQKLINDYNLAKEGLCDEEEASLYIERYKSFLSERKSIKEQVTANCKTYGIA